MIRKKITCKWGSRPCCCCCYRHSNASRWLGTCCGHGIGSFGGHWRHKTLLWPKRTSSTSLGPFFRVPGCHYYHWRSISLCRCCVVFIIHIGSKWHICRHHLDPVLVPCIVVTTIGDVGWGLWHGSQSLLVMVAVHMVSLVITNNKKKRTQGSRRNASQAPHPCRTWLWRLQS